MNLILIDALTSYRSRKYQSDSVAESALEALRQAVQDDPDPRWDYFLTVIEYVMSGQSRYNPILRIPPTGKTLGAYSPLVARASLVIEDPKMDVFHETSHARKSRAKSTRKNKTTKAQRSGRSQQ